MCIRDSLYSLFVSGYNNNTSIIVPVKITLSYIYDSGIYIRIYMRNTLKIIPHPEVICISKCVGSFNCNIVIWITTQKIPVKISIITADPFAYYFENITIPPGIIVSFRRIKGSESIILIIIPGFITENLGNQ